MQSVMPPALSMMDSAACLLLTSSLDYHSRIQHCHATLTHIQNTNIIQTKSMGGVQGEDLKLNLKYVKIRNVSLSQLIPERTFNQISGVEVGGRKLLTQAMVQ